MDNSRVRELRNKLHLSQKAFAEKIGLKQNSLSYIEKRATITDQLIKAICAQFPVNETWLRTGEGEMLREDNERKRVFFELFDQFHPVLQDYLLQTAINLLESQKKMRFEDADSVGQTEDPE